MRSLLLYAALVGLPLLGVGLVLHLGRGLTAPPSFGGTWALATAAYPDGCTPPSALHVEQSGARVRAGLGAGLTWTEFDGRGFRTLAPVRASSGTCATWHVEAQGNGGEVPTHLTGRLVPQGCACAPVPFRARREAARTDVAH